MVQFKPVGAFFAIAFLVAQSAVAEEAHALQLFPELKESGPGEVVYKDPDTHKVVIEKIDENGQGSIQKRSCRYRSVRQELSLTAE